MSFKPSLNWLLVFVPAAILLDFLQPASHTLIFLISCVAVIPLAGWLGRATEHLAEHTGEGVGGLLNATFGNAAELIIALLALKAGLPDVVKASITGSIIGNILLVLGASFLGGGLKHKVQKFNVTGARAQATTMTLAAIALLMPALFHSLATAGDSRAAAERTLSVEISVVLIVTYGLMLLFSLHTHKQLFVGAAKEAAEVEAKSQHEAHWSLGKSLGVLTGAAVMVGWISEILVGSVEGAAHQLGMSQVFVGVVVVAIVGNAAEHSTAILVAFKNRMDLALSIAVGSSIQIALFVAPVLVFASYFLGPAPMDLVFTPAEVVAVLAAVVIANQVTNDGESNWLEGAQLLAVYLIIGIIFYFLPDTVGHALPATAAH
ncbi:MAG: calcium/proton exchanger [Thermoanaerobaculia bacterium]|nr:calcium/proton exchanger [Thermoanaerobaculia bacterium]